MNPLIFLTESGQKRGYGHLIRMTALFEESLKNHKESFLLLDNEEEELPLLAHRKTILLKWKKQENLEVFFEKYKNFNLIVDSYETSEDFCFYLSQRAEKVIFIDDNNRINYPLSSWIVNPSPYGYSLSYPKEIRKNLRSGKEYIILREEFLKKKKENFPSKFVFLLMGGTDPYNLTSKIKKSLEKAGWTPKIIQNASAQEIVEIMDNSYFGVIGGGQTLIESASQALPSFVIEIADNQKNNIAYFQERKLLLGSFSLEEIKNIKPSVWRVSEKERERIYQSLKNSFSQISKGKKNILKLLLN